MTKIAILGDTHFGMRNDHKRILQYQCDFYEKEFFPYIDKHGIKEIIQTGDFFDSRRYVCMPTLAMARKYFIDPCIERGITVKIIAGNHDLPYRYNNKFSSVKQILEKYENFHVYENEVFEDEHGIKYFPWISPENQEAMLAELQKGGNIAVGHFETTNFAMERNQMCTHGTTTLNDFKGFNVVISGHFHHRSKNKNLIYVGVPYEMSFNDCFQKKGFHILDTDAKSLVLIESKMKLFHSIDVDTDDQNMDLNQFKNLGGCFVRMRIIRNNDPQKVGQLISLVNSQTPHDFKIIDKSLEKLDSENVDEIINNQTTEEMIVAYVDLIAGSNTLKDKVIEKTLKIHQLARERQLQESK